MSDRNIIPSFLRIRCWSRNGRIAGRLRPAGGHGWTSENQRCGSVPHPGGIPLNRFPADCFVKLFNTFTINELRSRHRSLT